MSENKTSAHNCANDYTMPDCNFCYSKKDASLCNMYKERIEEDNADET